MKKLNISVALVTLAAAGAAIAVTPATAQTAPSVEAAPRIPVESAPLPPQGQQALEASPSGTVTQWKNPDGATSTFVPQPAFQTSAGQICREFQQTVTIAGRPQQAYGTACRQPDGSWKLQPAPSSAAPAPVASPAPAPTVVYAPPPPAVVYPYPAYFPPGYYYPRPYYTTVFIGVGGGHHHHH